MDLFKCSKFRETILVLGFYNRDNLGDEAFKPILKKMFNDYILIFRCVDDITIIPSEVTIILVGGGDIINEYFCSKIKILLSVFNGRCYAVSVGIPYLSSINYLKMFDHVFLRTKQDLKIAADTIGSENLTYVTDLVFSYPKLKKPKNKILGVSLAQPAFNKNNNTEFLCDKFIKVLKTLSSSYKIVLILYNNSSNLNESDLVISHYIKTKLDIEIIESKTVLELQNTIASLDLLIGMRFHSIVMAIKYNIPFVALYTTRKIENLLKDYNLTNQGVKFVLDKNDMPINFDINKLIHIIINIDSFKNVDVEPVNYDIVKNYIKNKKKKVIYNTIVEKEPLALIYKNCKNILVNFNNLNIKNNIDLARCICYCLFKNVESKYVWGLSDIIVKKDFDINKSIEWIYNDYWNNNTNFIKCPKINIEPIIHIDIDYINQNNYRDLHRAGWAFVTDGLQYLSYTNTFKSPQILVDTCVDRTFHWGYNALLTANVIPYKKPWMGFIHHTFDQTYSSYNCVELFKNPNFIKSLKYCVCLFVLTKYLADELNIYLEKYNIPVEVLTHPTEFVNNKFTLAKWNNNTNKKVISIGAWLRNPYAIYDLPLYNDNIKKVSLKGKFMENNFLSNKITIQIDDNVIESNESVSRPELCRSTNDKNKYIQYLLNSIDNKYKNVNIINYLDNNEYDKLLSENIVFLNLIDASAVNTIIECIIRNTVIFVNRIPPTEEILGKDYPGLYNNLYECSTFILDFEHIKKTYIYLTKMNKEKYKLDYFINSFQNAAMKYIK
jgi:hypothetical protein